MPSTTIGVDPVFHPITRQTKRIESLIRFQLIDQTLEIAVEAEAFLEGLLILRR
jgi:hypothetical protein